MTTNILIHSGNLASLHYLLINKLIIGNKTSFLPDFFNETISVAKEYRINPNLIT
jgi:hypothetical protein